MTSANSSGSAESVSASQMREIDIRPSGSRWKGRNGGWPTVAVSIGEFGV